MFESVCFLSRRFYVIVKRWSGTEKGEDLRAIPTSNLMEFESSDDGKKAYIAVAKNKYESGTTIKVGDGTTYLSSSQTSRRKRRNTQEYKNAPLSENTQYAIFIRVFYDENKVSIF